MITLEESTRSVHIGWHQETAEEREEREHSDAHDGWVVKGRRPSSRAASHILSAQMLANRMENRLAVRRHHARGCWTSITPLCCFVSSPCSP